MRQMHWGTLAVLIMASLLGAPAVWGRTWTSKQGTSIEADYVSQKDGEIQLKVKATGKIVTLRIDQLTPDDQKYAASLESQPKAEPGPSDPPKADPPKTSPPKTDPSKTEPPKSDPAGKPPTEASNAPPPVSILVLLPKEVDQGNMLTLQVNAKELAKGMPSVNKPGPNGASGKTLATLDAVDFYRDSNDDGKYSPDKDKYLGTDSNVVDGFSLEVSTEKFPPGENTFFAVPRSVSSDNSLPLAANLLTALAEAEARIGSEASAAATGGGLSAEKAFALSNEQSKITSKIGNIVNDVKQSAPDAAKLLGETRALLSKSNAALGRARKSPGGSSIGPATEAGASASSVAKQLTQVADMLVAGANSSAPARPGSPGIGRPVMASGIVNARSGSGAKGAGGGGGNGDGDGDGGGRGRRGRGRGGVHIDDGIDYASEAGRLRIHDRARELVDERDYDGAVLEYDRLLVDNPKDLYTLRQRAHTYLERGGYEDAIVDYNELITLDKENADFYYNRGCAYLAAGKLDSALADFTKSIELNETGHLAFNNRGTTFARQGQFAKAVADFSMAIKLEPNDQLAFHNRGLAYRKLEMKAEAEADFAKAKALGEGK